MKYLITAITAVVLVGTAFADPIHSAAARGDLAGVQAELNNGADVNAKFREGLVFHCGTPLHYAVDGGYKEVAELLINKGADVQSKDKCGESALHTAAIRGYEDIAELLIANGADVNAKDRSDRTPLHKAVTFFHYHKEVAELLIAEGADVNAKDYDDSTPLREAFRFPDAVKLLIENGADVNSTTMYSGKQTILDWYSIQLRFKWKDEVKDSIEVIRKHGGKKYYEMNPAEICFVKGWNFIENKEFKILVGGNDGETYDILYSADLKNWKVIKTITIDGYDNSIKSETSPGSSFFKIRPTD